jgi:hypothetical protein
MLYYDDNGKEVEEHEYFSCTNKIRFRTKEKAVNQLKDFNKKKMGGGSDMKVYPCDYCNGFHLGRLLRKQSRKIIR